MTEVQHGRQRSLRRVVLVVEDADEPVAEGVPLAGGVRALEQKVPEEQQLLPAQMEGEISSEVQREPDNTIFSQRALHSAASHPRATPHETTPANRRKRSEQTEPAKSNALAQGDVAVVEDQLQEAQPHVQQAVHGGVRH